MHSDEFLANSAFVKLCARLFNSFIRRALFDLLGVFPKLLSGSSPERVFSELFIRRALRELVDILFFEIISGSS